MQIKQLIVIISYWSICMYCCTSTALLLQLSQFKSLSMALFIFSVMVKTFFLNKEPALPDWPLLVIKLLSHLMIG